MCTICSDLRTYSLFMLLESTSVYSPGKIAKLDIRCVWIANL